MIEWSRRKIKLKPSDYNLLKYLVKEYGIDEIRNHLGYILEDLCEEERRNRNADN